MSNNPEPRMKKRSISCYVILGAGLFAFIQTFSLLSPILLSFVLVLLIALAINPLISRMRALTGGRKISTGLVALAMVAAIALVGWALFGPMKDSVLNISEALPGYWERLQKPLIKMERQAVIFEQKLQTEVSTEIAKDASEENKIAKGSRVVQSTPVKRAEDAKSLRSSLSEMIQGVLGSFTAVAFNGAQILVVFVTVFFGVLYMLMNPRPIIGAMFALLPEQRHNQTLVIMQRIGRFIPIWAGATLLGMVTIGVLVFLLMWPIFGFMDALVLGLTAAVLEVIPFLGPIFASIPAILLALSKGGMTPVWVVLAYISVQALESNVILPFIMARGMKLHPLAVIFSMLLCVAAFGVLGVLVAAPMVAIVSIVHDEFYRKIFLPTVTDADLDRLAGMALHEKQSIEKC
ncbi:MAG: AI-2E family transporter [Proteobacteria bacterium]|nr:AI-2E family transporter [Pseudomonadota bacterium]